MVVVPLPVLYTEGAKVALTALSREELLDMALEVGQVAPDFSLPATGGGTVTLSELRGKPVVLFFYPKDDTPG